MGFSVTYLDRSVEYRADGHFGKLAAVFATCLAQGTHTEVLEIGGPLQFGRAHPLLPDEGDRGVHLVLRSLGLR
jgi:hypothetical protein